MASNVPRSIITHNQRVCRLYKRATRALEDIFVNDRSRFRFEAVLLRERFDVNLGGISDCWFLASLAHLAEADEAFCRVVPGDQSFSQGKYCGMFRFRFFRFGEWVEVVVDDRLPTRNGKLIYLRSQDENEFWSPLLEKAYAKFYGSYKALEGGDTIESAVDFTGGVPETMDISNLQMKQERLFNLLRKAYSNNAFMFCSLRVNLNLSVFLRFH